MMRSLDPLLRSPLVRKVRTACRAASLRADTVISALGQRLSTLSWLPPAAAIALAATEAPLAWSKDFGDFLCEYLVYWPLLYCIYAALALWAFVARRAPQFRYICMTLVVALIVPHAVSFVVPKIKDDVHFLIWNHRHHRLLAQFAGRDAIVRDLESWGMVGLVNESYLVSNPDDRLDREDERLKFLANIGSDCDIVYVKRVARGIFVATTFNCSLHCRRSEACW